MNTVVLMMSLIGLILSASMLFANVMVMGEETKFTRPIKVQSTNPEKDRIITRQIRSNLASDNKLSDFAKNIDIKTFDGRVTLQGNVETPEEKERVERHARHIVSSAKLISRLQIMPIDMTR